MRTGMLAGLVVVLLIPCSVWGMWAWTPPQVLVDQADYVVRGALVDVNEATGQANIKVEETLRGEVREKIPVKFAPAREGGMEIAEDEIRYGEGMTGYWILERPDKDGRYDLSYPLRRMQVEEAAQVKALVDNFKNIKWSKPVDGLACAVRAIRPQAGKDDTFTLYLAVKNTGDKPIFVQQAGGALTMHFTLKGPEGERQIKLPETSRSVPEKSVRLGPEQMLYVGFDWPSGLSTGALKQGAKYSTTGVYSFMPDKSKNIPEWMGTIETEPLEIRVGNQ